MIVDKKYLKRNRITTIVPFETNSTNVEEEWIFWKPAHLATALILILIFVVSIFLTLQFIIKYRKYRIAEDLDSLNDVSGINIIEFMNYIFFFEKYINYIQYIKLLNVLLILISYLLFFIHCNSNCIIVIIYTYKVNNLNLNKLSVFLSFHNYY